MEIHRKTIIGKTLTNLYFTEQDGPHDFCYGLAPAYYFSTIMEINYSAMFLFENDSIEPWNANQPIILLTHENWQLQPEIIFHNQIITAISMDDEQQISIHLENGTIIKHLNGYGDELSITNPSLESQAIHSSQSEQSIFSKFLKRIFPKK